MLSSLSAVNPRRQDAPRKGLVGTIIAVEDEDSFLVQFEGFATGHGFNCDCWYVGPDSVDLYPKCVMLIS